MSDPGPGPDPGGQKLTTKNESCISVLNCWISLRGLVNSSVARAPCMKPKNKNIAIF
jgi:hypothetical protein